MPLAENQKWDCFHCGVTRHAPCGATCWPAQRIDEREFKSARIARESETAAQRDVVQRLLDGVA